MTDDDPKSQRGLLPPWKPDPDWEMIAMSILIPATFLTLCALFLTVAIETLRDWGLLRLGAPLVAAYALRIVVLGVVLIPLDLPGRWGRSARRIVAASWAAGEPILLGTLAAGAVLYLHGGWPATLGLEDGTATLVQGVLLGLGVGAAIQRAALVYRAPRLVGRRW